MVTADGAPIRKARVPALDLDDKPAYSRAQSISRAGEAARLEDSGDRSQTADRVVITLDQVHGRALHGFVQRMGLRSDEADDAVQEVLLRLWQALRAGAVIDDPKAWSFRSIYRLAMDAHRWRRRIEAIRGRLGRGETHVSALDPDPGNRLSIWTEVDRLPPRQREILYLRYRTDMTFEQAAAVMGITPGAARANATKAMKTLRNAVGGRESW